MLICVDVGNTNIVVGIYQKEKLINVYRLETKVTYTSDEYGHQFINYLRFLNITKEQITGSIIASVVPTIDNMLEDMFRDYFNIEPIFIKNDMNLGLKIKLDNPKELGADLYVGAYMASKKYGAPCIVVDMGTANTYFAVNSKKEFLGGVIVPGTKEAFRSLVKATSLLESTKFAIPKNVIGNDTKTSMQSGMTYGTVAMFNGLTSMMIQEMQEENVKVVLTGGIAKNIAIIKRYYF